MIELKPPVGWDVFSAQEATFVDANGVIYWSGYFYKPGNEKDATFGWYVATQRGANPSVLGLKRVSGSLSLINGMLYAAFALPNDSRWFESVAGFARYGDEDAAPSPTPTRPITEGVDPVARGMAEAAEARANSAYEYAQAAMKKAQDAADATQRAFVWCQELEGGIKNRPDIQWVKDHVWAVSGERIKQWWNENMAYSGNRTEVFHAIANRVSRYLSLRGTKPLDTPLEDKIEEI